MYKKKRVKKQFPKKFFPTSWEGVTEGTHSAQAIRGGLELFLLLKHFF